MMGRGMPPHRGFPGQPMMPPHMMYGMPPGGRGGPPQHGMMPPPRPGMGMPPHPHPGQQPPPQMMPHQIQQQPISQDAKVDVVERADHLIQQGSIMKKTTKKKIIRIYDRPGVSMEEIRA